jgi:hypothetical protein
MGHDIWRSNRCGPRRLGQRPRAQWAGRPVAVVHDSLSLTAMRHGGRTNRHGPWRVLQTLAPRRQFLRLKTALKIIEINRKNLFLVEDPLTNDQVASCGIFRAKSRCYAIRGIWTPNLRLRANPPLPLQCTTTYVHTKFLFSSYYT